MSRYFPCASSSYAWGKCHRDPWGYSSKPGAREMRNAASVLHSARFAAMNLPLIASTFAALQVERATEPSYRGEGDGRLVVLEVPENVSLDFFVVRRARARDETTGEVTERESSFTVRGR